MRRSVAALVCALLVAGPALAQAADPADAAAAKPKMKKVCRADSSGNPLYPTMKCHLVPVETASATTPPAGTKPSDTQVALAPQADPR